MGLWEARYLTRWSQSANQRLCSLCVATAASRVHTERARRGAPGTCRSPDCSAICTEHAVVMRCQRCWRMLAKQGAHAVAQPVNLPMMPTDLQRQQRTPWCRPATAWNTTILQAQKADCSSLHFLTCHCLWVLEITPPIGRRALFCHRSSRTCGAAPPFTHGRTSRPPRCGCSAQEPGSGCLSPPGHRPGRGSVLGVRTVPAWRPSIARAAAGGITAAGACTASPGRGGGRGTVATTAGPAAPAHGGVRPRSEPAVLCRGKCCSPDE